MKEESELVTQALERTNAHGLARLVSEKRVYTRVLWLLAWLVCCGLFIRQLVGFIGRLQANDVTTNYRADEVPFEYPDLFLCFDNPMSGSRHLAVSQEFIKMANYTLQDVSTATEYWCSIFTNDGCKFIRDDSAELQINSMPYRKLVDEMSHSYEQSIISVSLERTNGLKFDITEMEAQPFYHPKHFRCFKISFDKAHREMMRFSRPDDVLNLWLMMDAPDERLGKTILPVISNRFSSFTAPFWALDRGSLVSKIRSSLLRVYVTRPGHYPSDFDDILVLEGGRSYSVQLAMQEQVHSEDPSKCVENPPIVQMVNPYDNTAYSAVYDYGYCYISVMQAQFKRLLNASLGYLPQPWPPADRLLYNLSSNWGSIKDILTYLEKRTELSLEEPLVQCSKLRPCTERSYMSFTRSTKWSVDSMIEEIEDVLKGVYNNSSPTSAPAVHFIVPRLANRTDRHAIDYLRANMLRLQVSAKKPLSDRIIFARAYSFESFVADVGGILGVYLGMSLLTLCELMQFLHDIVMLWWARSHLSKQQTERKLPL